MRLISLLLFALISQFVYAQKYGLDWALTAEDTISDYKGIAIVDQETDNQGNTYYCGIFAGQADLDPSIDKALIFENAFHSNFFIAKYDNLGNLIWVEDFGGGWSMISGLEIDDNGNLLIVGRVHSCFYYDPHNHKAHIKATYSNGWNANGFLVKYNTNGEFLWIKKLESIGQLEPADIELTNSQDIVISGFFNDKAIFSDSLQTDTLISNGMNDVFVSKYDANGNYLFSFSFGGDYDDKGYKVAVDNSNSIYLLSKLRDTVDIDPSISSYEVIQSSPYSSYNDANTLSKYDSLGNFLWGHLFENNWCYLRIRDIQTNSFNQVGITGKYKNYTQLIDFDMNNGVETINSFQDEGAFLALYDSSSNFLWNQDLGEDYVGNELAFNNLGQVYTVGEIMDNNGDPSDAFFHKTGNNGGSIFSNILNSWWEITGPLISLNSNEEPVITARYRDTVDLDPSSNNYYIPPPFTISGHRNYFCSNYSINGDLQYGFPIVDDNYYGTEADEMSDYSTSIELDTEGNIFAFGLLGGPADFNPSADTNVLTSTIQGDAFLVKYDSLGNYEWGFVIDSLRRHGGISVDNQGNSYLCVSTNGTSDLDPNTGVANHSNSGIVAKYDPAGNYIWSFDFEEFTNTSYTYLKDIEIDSSGNLIITGMYRGDIDFDPSSSQHILSSSNETTFIAKYDVNANLIWAVDISPLEMRTLDLAVNSNDDIFLTGSFMINTIDIDPSSNSYQLSKVALKDIILIKYDESANLQWGFNLGNTDSNWGGCVAATSDHVYLTGGFSETCDMDPSVNTFNLSSPGYITGTSTFIARYEVSNGELDWAFSLYGATSKPRGLDINSDENIVVHGYMSNNWAFNEDPIVMDVDPSPDTVGLISNVEPFHANHGMYTVVYDSTGALQWAMDMQYCTTPYVNPDSRDVAKYDNQGNILISGNLKYDGDFNPGTFEDVIDSRNGTEFFLSKYSECQTTYSTESVTACGEYNWKGRLLTSTGIYYDTISNRVGCDSVMSLDLEIQPVDSITESVVSCDNYTWSNGNTYSSSGTYYQYFTNMSGCDSIHELDLTIHNIDTSVTFLNDTTLFSNQNGADYQWIDCSSQQLIIGAENQSFTPQTSGMYAAIISLASCTDTTSCTSINLAQLDQEQNLSHIKVFPNPTDGSLNIELDENLDFVNVQLLDATGREYLNKNYKNTSIIELNLDYKPGTYLLILKNDGEIIQQRIVIGN